MATDKRYDFNPDWTPEEHYRLLRESMAERDAEIARLTQQYNDVARAHAILLADNDELTKQMDKATTYIQTQQNKIRYLQDELAKAVGS